MANTCYDTNLLTNSGTNQAERALAALQGSYAQIDERSLAALIVFVRKYSAYLNYYNQSNSLAGDWQPFMQNDVAVSAANIALLNTSDYTTYLANLYDYILTPTTGSETPSYPDPLLTFKYIFDLVASIASLLNLDLAAIPTDTDYQPFLSVAIGSKLAAPLQLLADYYRWLQTEVPLPAVADSITDPNGPVTPVRSIDQLNFLGNAPWSYAIPSPNPLYSIYYDPGAGIGTILCQITASPVFTGTVTDFLNGVIYIVNQTNSEYLADLLTGYPEHTPHYTLLLAFLQLFQTAQQHLNHFTSRHLRFYYRKVLQLKPANGVPDIANIVFTLQKNTPQHLLGAGTLFQAGKDATGNPVSYVLDNEIVLNQASIQTMSALFLVTNTAPAVPQLLYASPTANSADGHGGKLITPDQSWYPFGDLTNPVFTSAYANIGFAVASDLLFLAEGKRAITLAFTVTDPTTGAAPVAIDFPAALFDVRFTGPKKWFEATDYGTVTPSYASGVITLTIAIGGNAPAIVPYSVKLHGGSYPQTLPMVSVGLITDPASTGYTLYSQIKSYVIGSLELSVIAYSVQNLSLQNQDGKINPSKPFNVFGAFPDTGAAFIIGSKEVFQKPLTTLSVNLALTSGSSGSALTAQPLADGAWQPTQNTVVSPSGGSPLPAAPNSINLETNIPLLGTDPVTGATAESSTNTLFGYFLSEGVPPADFDTTAPVSFSSTSQSGYIAFFNQDADWSLSSYLSTVQTNVASTTATINVDTTHNTTTYTMSNPVVTKPNTPPMATGVYLTYTAARTLLSAGSYATREDYFYHVEPFGFREMHPDLFVALPPGAVAGAPDNQMNFLPVFHLDDTIAQAGAGALPAVTPSVLDNGSAVSPDNGGELWIGITGALAGETHSILFQVSEGSSNPLKSTTTVQWYYMVANNWVPLSDTVVDGTNDLSTSGIVVLPLPGNETMNNTRAAAGLVWIKAVVAGNTDAVCRIIAIQPNAAAASFLQDLPKKIDFTANIPAGTISKLVNADAAIKQLSQPYASSGGRPAETKPEFNLRVSERLRHKRRAVTAWDYERLVLQQFPQIHKVKCLNHTLLDTETQAYSELAPGHVLVVTIPDLRLVTGANPYLPFTDLGLLTTIADYLAPLTSLFVKLVVQNPLFEGIQIECNVSFKAGYDKNFYSGQLNTDLMNFLMPWAAGSTTQDINFGGSIEKSSLVNFIQTRDYVDFTTCVKMYRYIYTESGFTPGTHGPDLDVAVATTARSVFVPYYIPGMPPTGNIIHPTADCNCNGQ